MTRLPDRSLHRTGRTRSHVAARAPNSWAPARLSSIPGPLLVPVDSRRRQSRDDLAQMPVRRPPPRRHARRAVDSDDGTTAGREGRTSARRAVAPQRAARATRHRVLALRRWAVDFHAGKVTRPHDDLDVAVWSHDGERAHELLTAAGWRHTHPGRGLQRVRSRRRSSRGCVCRPRRMASELVKTRRRPETLAGVRAHVVSLSSLKA